MRSVGDAPSLDFHAGAQIYQLRDIRCYQRELRFATIDEHDGSIHDSDVPLFFALWPAECADEPLIVRMPAELACNERSRCSANLDQPLAQWPIDCRC